jgi:hypothetical protein
VPHQFTEGKAWRHEVLRMEISSNRERHYPGSYALGEENIPVARAFKRFSRSSVGGRGVRFSHSFHGRSLNGKRDKITSILKIRNMSHTYCLRECQWEARKWCLVCWYAYATQAAARQEPAKTPQSGAEWSERGVSQQTSTCIFTSSTCEEST